MKAGLLLFLCFAAMVISTWPLLSQSAEVINAVQDHRLLTAESRLNHLEVVTQNMDAKLNYLLGGVAVLSAGLALGYIDIRTRWNKR